MTKVNITLILNDEYDKGGLEETLDVMSFDELFAFGLRDMIKGIELGRHTYYDGVIVEG